VLATDLVERVTRVIGSNPDSGPVWVVGGTVRDALLGREVTDLDLAVPDRASELARMVAAGMDGVAFELSGEYSTWRAMDRDGAWQVDVAKLRDDGIENDLRHRDFTVGAIAVEIGSGELHDPTGGIADLTAGVLRQTGPGAFPDDPLRLIRAARLAAQFGFELDPETVATARRAASMAADPAGERILSEFLLLVGSRDPLRGIDVLDQLGALDVAFPELAGMKGVEQGPNHHRDVFGHTQEVLEGVLRIESELDRFVGDLAPEVADLLSEPLADGLNRSGGLRLGALFHDCAKPQTRNEEGGFISFRGHDVEGARMIQRAFGRLRASRRLTDYVADLARHHLILGFMVPERPLSRSQVFRYLKRTEPVSVDVTLLTVADRLAARGTGPVASSDMVAGHLELAGEMVAAGLEWTRGGAPKSPLTGDQLMEALGLEPGPELGRIIEGLEEAAYTGEIGSAKDAVEKARDLLGRG
jgi:poly(A) polymerase